MYAIANSGYIRWDSVLADRPDGPKRVVHVVGDGLEIGFSARCDVDRDAVRGLRRVKNHLIVLVDQIAAMHP